MALEKRWFPVSSQALISDGTSDGIITIANAKLFKVKQRILLHSSIQSTKKLEIKRIDSDTTLHVGDVGKNIHHRTDVSLFLVADASFIIANEQDRPNISPDDVTRAVFEEEPSVALRSLLVNRCGDPVGLESSNPFYVQLSDGSVNIGTVNAELEVQLSHKDDDPDSGDVHDSVRIGDGVEEVTLTDFGSSKNMLDVTPFNIAVARGKIPGFESRKVFGINFDIDVSNEEDVWSGGGTYSFPTSAQVLSIQSDNINDDSTGSGGREITVLGLDSNYDEISEVISLDGTTTVTSTSTFLRVFSAEVTDVGGSGVNEGTITGGHGVTILFNIQPETNRSLLGLTTIPAGKTAYLDTLFASLIPAKNANGVKEGELTLFSTKSDNNIFIKTFSFGLSSRATAPFDIEFNRPFVFTEKSDIKFRLKAHSNNSKILIGFTLLLEDNP